MKIRNSICATAVAAMVPLAASAQAIITDGKIVLGVDTLGQLNIDGGVLDIVGDTTIVGLRTTIGGVEYESTSHGCLCEGWGVTAGGITAYADNSAGIANLTGESFTSDASTATSVVAMTSGELRVAHAFAPSGESADLYRVTVTIENISGGVVTDVGYRRVMDWDTSPTPFNEFVSIGGRATTTLLESSSTNGFLGGDMNNLITDVYGCDPGGDSTVDFTDCGPTDHGSVFDFAFGDLDAGEIYSFDIFYGASTSTAAAFAALGAVEAELYSFGRSGEDVNDDGLIDGSGAPAPTFVFAFAGVGGTIVVPPVPTVPLPAGGLLLLTGLGAIAHVRRKRNCI